MFSSPTMVLATLLKDYGSKTIALRLLLYSPKNRYNQHLSADCLVEKYPFGKPHLRYEKRGNK